MWSKKQWSMGKALGSVATSLEIGAKYFDMDEITVHLTNCTCWHFSGKLLKTDVFAKTLISETFLQHKKPTGYYPLPQIVEPLSSKADLILDFSL